ncbi:MAG: AraC family transcriptional regulator [Acidiferrobacterales bacterium]|nr:AraC family transcriptional regulator [Acidiferrobacterales bacterium]
MTSCSQISRINDVLYCIHQDIAADLSAHRLSKVACFSEQHFHRVFRKITGESVHQYVRRTRLEHAANQLTFDVDNPVVEIAQKCGFHSLSSFTHAFKRQFHASPGQWRKREYQTGVPQWHRDQDFVRGERRIKNLALPDPVIQQLPARTVAYIRHVGYGRSIASTWQLLSAWCQQECRSTSTQIGLHHSNPEWVPLNQCRYVACVEIDRPMVRNGRVHCLTIPGGWHACFEITGQYGDLLPWISRILNEWLPSSGLKMQTTPAFAVYNRNHFLERDEKFSLSYCLPVTFY